MSPKGAGRQVLRINLLPGPCVDKKLTVAETNSGGLDGGGGGSPQHGVRTETLLPEELFGGRTSNLDLVTVPSSLNYHAFQRKEMAKSSSPALFPMSHPLCLINLPTPLCPFVVCSFTLPGNSVARKRQFAL